MRVFLSGPMGVGKSTVARLLAALLGAEALDLDALVEARAGRSVRELFAERGERAFRALEREEARRLAARGGSIVVALGGGTVCDPETRALLLQAGCVVTLEAPADELARRVGASEGRPLLRGRDARAAMAQIVEERAGAYGEAHGRVGTRGREPAEVAALVAELVREEPVLVPLGRRSYRVEIGAGIRRRLSERAAAAARGRVIWVTDPTVDGAWGRALRAELEEAGRGVVVVVLEAGEAHKTLGSVERIWDAALAAGADREALVVGVGGGVVCDVAGFAAATLLRGVALGLVPTTLLAMADASVGGKTAIDRPQGKNLVGAFHQPAFVLADPETLATLPGRERAAGLAEIVKAAWLAGEGEVRALEADAEALAAGEPGAVARAVRMAVRLKARIVCADEREAGARRLLNLGHTFGHALEAAGGYERWRHGEAVALGMVAAFGLSRARGHARAQDAARALGLLRALGLPTALERGAGAGAARYLRADKKRAGESVLFVSPGAPGDTRVERLDLSELEAALSER